MSWFGREEEKAAVIRAPRAKPYTGSGRVIHSLLFLGQPGAGKTTDLQELVERNWLDGCRFVISDRLGYWGYMAKWPHVDVLSSVTHEEAARFAIQKRPYSTVVIDEVAEAFPRGKMPGPETALSEIMRAGRNACAHGEWKRPGPVALAGACQSPYQVDVAARGLFDRFFIGRLEEQASLSWVAGIHHELPELVRHVPYGRFLVYDRM